MLGEVQCLAIGQLSSQTGAELQQSERAPVMWVKSSRKAFSAVIPAGPGDLQA